MRMMEVATDPVIDMVGVRNRLVAAAGAALGALARVGVVDPDQRAVAVDAGGAADP